MGTNPQSLIANSEADKLRAELGAVLDEVRRQNRIDPAARVRTLPQSLLDIERDFVTAPPDGHEFGYAIDEDGRQLREQLERNYGPGSPACDEVLQLAGISSHEIDPQDLRRLVRIQFMHKFGPSGENLKRPLSRNQEAAEQALLQAIAQALRNQSFQRTARLIPDDARREALIDKLEDWSRNGIPDDPEPDAGSMPGDRSGANDIEEEEPGDA
jgi:hypothetical protein